MTLYFSNLPCNVCVKVKEIIYLGYLVAYENKNGHQSITNFIQTCSQQIYYLPKFYAPVWLTYLEMVILKEIMFKDKKIKKKRHDFFQLPSPFLRL